MKQRLIWFNLQRDGTRNGLSNIKETSAENLQLKISVLHTNVWTFWSLKFIWWLGKINVKKKYLMCQIPIKMLKQHATLNSSWHSLKIYWSKERRKLPSEQILVPGTSRGRPPRTSPGRPVNIPFDRPGDVLIWRPRDVPIWRPGNVLKWRPRHVLIWRSRDVVRRLI